MNSCSQEMNCWPKMNWNIDLSFLGKPFVNVQYATISHLNLHISTGRLWGWSHAQKNVRMLVESD